MKHIAALVHGNKFMILLPLAELRDLEIFLRGGKTPMPDTRHEEKVYDFYEEFSALKDKEVFHRALIKESFEISSALLWLHEELRIYERLDYYLAHMDLKPANILIDRDEDLPAGKWMISDFGVSLFDKRTNEAVSNPRSIRDLVRKVTSRADQHDIHRLHGAYSPPEFGSERIDGRKCDVWSFACILCDVLAFALGGSEEVRRFRSARYDRSDNFFRVKDTSVSRTKTIDNATTEVKPVILEWLHECELKNSYPWIAGYVQVIRKALNPDPLHRPDIRKIMDDLGIVKHNFSSSSTAPERAPQQRTVPRPLSGNAIADSSPAFVPVRLSKNYKSLPPLRIILPKEKVIAVALHRAGEHAAFLFKDLVCIHSTEVNATGTKRIQLSSGVHWTGIVTAREQFAVQGQSSTDSKYVSMRLP